MKIRTTFVSNSSSCSFVINHNPVKEEYVPLTEEELIALIAAEDAEDAEDAEMQALLDAYDGYEMN